MNRYLVSAFRNLFKRRLSATVNIVSLTFGLLCALYIGTYLIYEFSFDSHYADKSRLYRVNNTSPIGNGDIERGVIVPTGIKAYFDENYDQVELSSRVQRAGQTVFSKVDGTMFTESKVFFADPELIDILEIQVLHGDGHRALSNANSIFISQSMSEKYFGTEPALGKSIKINSYYTNGSNELLIDGVFEDFPQNSHFQADFLFSIELLRKKQRRPIDQEWSNSNCFTYLKLAKNVDPDQFASLIEDAVIEHNRESDYDWSGRKLLIQPVADIHMQDFVAFGDLPGRVKKSNMFILIGIGILILVLVCINFFNMSTAMALERAKEIGIRKSIGAIRSNLMFQFMTEAALQVTLGILFCLILFEVSNSYFSNITGLSFSISSMIEAFGYFNFIGFIVALWSLLILGSGLYPAIVISKYNAVEALSGKVRKGKLNQGLGKLLLVLQFTITLVISITALVVYNQVRFLENKDPGYQRDSMVALSISQNKLNDIFTEEVSKDPLLESITFIDDNILQIFNSSSDYSWQGKSPDEDIRIFRLSVDNNFIPSMGIKLLEGRNFDPQLETDNQVVILNKAAANIMQISSVEGFPIITKGKGEWLETLHVVGIVDDFQIGDQREKSKPMLMYRNPERGYMANIRISSTQPQEAILHLEALWEKLIPERPFQYKLLDEGYEAMLKKDKASSSTLLFFTLVSIVISFLGLFGITSLNIQSKIKELGIRKILGADYKHIFIVVSNQFRSSILMAMLIGIPLAWFFGNQWLNEFSERIDVANSIPLVVIGMAFIGLLTLYFSTFKLTKTNPVDILRKE